MTKGDKTMQANRLFEREADRAAYEGYLLSLIHI